VRRIRDGLQFASVRHALRFLFERGPSMQGALSHHPRGHQAADGSTVYLQVDGEQGSDLHELMCTLQTVHDALAALRMDLPVAHEMLVLHVRDGRAMSEIGKLSQCSPSTVSAEIGRADGFLLGLLRRGGVVLPAPGGVSP
jgi:DNA-directed RNA polymerase specialized sigma24 family protein